MHVALIKTGALGDVVRTTALVPGLLRLDPETQLTWITAPSALDLVRHHPHVSRAVSIDDPPNAPWRLDSYDWIISLDDGAEESRLASTLAASAARLSGAYETPDGRLLYTQDVEPWFGMGILRPAEQGGLVTANALKAQNTKTVATLLYECLALPAPVGHTLIAVPEAESQSRLRLARLRRPARPPPPHRPEHRRRRSVAIQELGRRPVRRTRPPAPRQLRRRRRPRPGRPRRTGPQRPDHRKSQSPGGHPRPHGPLPARLHRTSGPPRPARHQRLTRPSPGRLPERPRRLLLRPHLRPRNRTLQPRREGRHTPGLPLLLPQELRRPTPLHANHRRSHHAVIRPSLAA